MQRNDIFETAASRMQAEKAENSYTGEETVNESSERLYQSLKEKLNL
jgi:hypothetical protein